MVKNIAKRQRRLESDYKHVVENPVVTETLQVNKKTKQTKSEYSNNNCCVNDFCKCFW